jgi:phosphoglycerate kinase
VDVRGKKVLVRADLDVPVTAGVVTEKARLKAFLPTLNELSEKGARVVILAHLGRPKFKQLSYTLRPVAEALAVLWGRPIAFAPDCVGAEAVDAVAGLQAGQAVVLENTRFHPEEEANDPAFAAALAQGGELFVNDAFAAYRPHASTEGLSHFLPAVAGRQMQAELAALGKALEKPARPVMALVGGAKISTKLGLLQNLIQKVDVLALGGVMANTFLAAQGVALGRSLVETEMLERAREIMAAARERGCRLLLPVDVVTASALTASAPAKIVPVAEISADQAVFDLGPATIALLKAALAHAKTLLWNGPLGAFELTPFDRATKETAQEVARLTREGKLLSVAGGGDTAAALSRAGAAQGVSHLSLAGGAFLKWLEGEELPCVAALSRKNAHYIFEKINA